MISLEARLEHALDWTEPRPIMTKRGGTLMRCAPPTERFWYLWKRYKPETRKLGILPRKIGTEWEVVQFMDGHLHEIETDIVQMNTAGLLEWQIEPMKRLVKVLRSRISAIDSSDTGTGKTYVACAVARQLGLELAVVCPKAVIPSWAEAAKLIGCEVRFILNYEALKAKKGEKYVIWDKEGYAVWKIKSGEQILLVFDEAHRCKDPALSKNALLLVSAVAQKIRHLLVSATLAERKFRTTVCPLGRRCSCGNWPVLVVSDLVLLAEPEICGRIAAHAWGLDSRAARRRASASRI